MVLTPQLPPDLTDAVDLEVVMEDPADLRLQCVIKLGTRRSLARISTPGDMSVISRRGICKTLQIGSTPIRLAVIVDEGDHGLNRRSSSAWAK